MSSQALFLSLFFCLIGAASELCAFPSHPEHRASSLSLASSSLELHSSSLVPQRWDCRIFGRVVSRGDAQAGVTVKIEGPVSLTTTTNANGEYSFQNLPPGTYKVSFHGGARFQREDRILTLRGFGTGPL